MNSILQKCMFSFRVVSFIFSISFVNGYGMESAYEYCSSTLSLLYSYTPSFFSQSSDDSQRIKDIRKNKNYFEKELQLSNVLNNCSSNVAIGLLYLNSNEPDYNLFNVFLQSPIAIQPINFLRYCYYQKFHDDNSKEDMQALASYENLLNDFKNIHIKECSALGAAIMAPGVSIKSKRNFIKQLMHLGFQLTQKDRVLAELQLYDAVPESEKTKMLLFLTKKDMLPEIKQNIVGYMLQPYRLMSWSLPE